MTQRHGRSSTLTAPSPKWLKSTSIDQVPASDERRPLANPVAQLEVRVGAGRVEMTLRAGEVTMEYSSSADRMQEFLNIFSLVLADGANITSPIVNRGQIIIDSLNKIDLEIARDPSLRAVFEAHRLVDPYLEARGAPYDSVFEEISREVLDKWEARKRDHSGEPWIRNPSTFVKHVYGRWYRAGTLKQVHLKHDPTLYQRYAKHISEKPADDLGLERAPGGRPRREPLRKNV